MKGNNPIDKLRAQLRARHGTPWQDRRQKVEAKGIPDEELRRLRELANRLTQSVSVVVEIVPQGQLSSLSPLTVQALKSASDGMLALLDEVARLKAVALTFEDEADRLGAELRAELNANRILREQLTKPEADCEAPVSCCLHKDGEG